jgi:hypothetical protein
MTGTYSNGPRSLLALDAAAAPNVWSATHLTPIMLDVRRFACAFALTTLLSSPAFGQHVPGFTDPPARTPAVLSRTAFTFLGGFFLTSDPRYSYDGRLSGDFDVVDYGKGRTNLLVDYEMVVGHERRTFDVNHGNYAIDVSSSYRTPWLEGAVFFHHVSRHLADRENPSAISWNVIGARAMKRLTLPVGRLDVSIDIGHAMQQAFVDYTWMTSADVGYVRPISPRLAAFASGRGEIDAVNHTANRGAQYGARLEAGFRITGKAAHADIFFGYERRIDGFPTERTRARFFTIGCRIGS